MNTGPVFPYSIAMVILCFGLGMFNKRQNKKINNVSTILTAESKSNFIDGFLSLGVGLAVIPLASISQDSSLGFLHYTGDFFITSAMVFASVKEPIRVFLHSFRELSGGTIDEEEVTHKITSIVTKHLSSITDRFECSIYKVGMLLKIQICVPSLNIQLQTLECIREKITAEVSSSYENVEVIFKI